MTRKLTILLLAGLAAVTACTSIDCPVQNTVLSYYSIRNASNQVDTLRDTLSILISRRDKDTLLRNRLADRVSFSMPVGYHYPVDTLYFLFTNKGYQAVDTVMVAKENYPHFESVDCSPTFFHRLTGVRTTHHAIDSITINNPTVDYDPTAIHFHLYPKSRD